VVRHIPVGYFPYDVALSSDGAGAFVSNWGITAYKFANPSHDATGVLTAVAPAGPNEPAGYFVPKTDTQGANPKSSSVSLVSVSGGNGGNATLLGSIFLGHRLDDLFHVGDTHPSATALVSRKHQRVLYVTRSNSDSLALINVSPPDNQGADEDGDGDD